MGFHVQAAAAVAATFRAFGRLATYTAPDTTVTEGVRIIIKQPDIVAGISGPRRVMITTFIEVQATELPAPMEDGVFDVDDGRRLKITQPPIQPDPDRLVWHLEAAPHQPVHP